VHSETPLLMIGRPIRGPGMSAASIPVHLMAGRRSARNRDRCNEASVLGAVAQPGRAWQPERPPVGTLLLYAELYLCPAGGLPRAPPAGAAAKCGAAAGRGAAAKCGSAAKCGGAAGYGAAAKCGTAECGCGLKAGWAVIIKCRVGAADLAMCGPIGGRGAVDPTKWRIGADRCSTCGRNA
jgi:hypothetical protein